MYAQGSNFYFQEAQPAGLEEIDQIVGEITGEYIREENKHVKIIVAMDSVYCRYPVVMHKAVAEIEAEGEYEIKGDEIFGVHESKGLPLQIINDTAVFVHYAHELIFAPGKSGVMKKHNGVYYFNYLEKNGYYTTVALSIRGDNLYMHSLDHYMVMPQIRSFSTLEETELDGVKTYLAAPSKDEMISFYESKGFQDKIKYLRKPE